MVSGTGASSVDSEGFARDGYLVFDPEIPEEVLDGAVFDAEQRFPSRLGWLPLRRTAPLADLGRFTDAWRRSDNVRRIALAPVTLQVLRDLYQREPRPFQTLNFRFGSQQLAHSDAVHFNTEPRGLMCGVWVALEDVDMENGPLVYYPGSQKLPEVMPSDVGMEVNQGQAEAAHEDYRAAYEPYIQGVIQREGLEPRYGTVRKGQAIIWSTNLLHGGTPVRGAGRTRHSQVTHYFFEGSRLWAPLDSTTEHVAWRDPPRIG